MILKVRERMIFRVRKDRDFLTPKKKGGRRKKEDEEEKKSSGFERDMFTDFCIIIKFMTPVTNLNLFILPFH